MSHKYISNTCHYKEVLSRVPHVKHSLWIGTAGIGMKDAVTRNFEAGILTVELEIVEQAMNQFDVA